NRFISAHFTTIHCELECHGLCTKKLYIIAAEQNEKVRADFIRRMSMYDAEQMIFMDETSKDEQTKTQRYALSLDGMIAATACEGSMTWEKFLQFLEGSVV
ncbi:hypothetical protein BDP27DRAFT_1200122, partial [Rhodocollybia butyracea]